MFRLVCIKYFYPRRIPLLDLFNESLGIRACQMCSLTFHENEIEFVRNCTQVSYSNSRFTETNLLKYRRIYETSLIYYYFIRDENEFRVRDNKKKKSFRSEKSHKFIRRIKFYNYQQLFKKKFN